MLNFICHRCNDEIDPLTKSCRCSTVAMYAQRRATPLTLPSVLSGLVRFGKDGRLGATEEV